MKFARKLDGSRFNWPPVEDISIISRDQIEMLLRPLIINTKNDRLTSFTNLQFFRTEYQVGPNILFKIKLGFYNLS